MGLDIYLYQYKNFADTTEREKKGEEHSEKLWSEVGEYPKLTDEQKDEVRAKEKEYYNSLGLDEWGIDITDKTQIEEDSKIDPEHMFKIGYFRSSYNNSGIERVLRNLGIPTLHDIFDYNDQYKFQPDWESALEKVTTSIELLENAPKYSVTKVSGNIFSPSEVKSEKDALDTFLKYEKSDRDYNFSNRDGEFFLQEPLKVHAIIPGKCTILKEQECVYVITDTTNDWYITALKIVKQTIEYVLSQENKEQYYLHWSG